MKALVSGSSLSRVARCAPSAVLPRVDTVGKNVSGTAIHEHLHDRVRLGVDAAMERIPEVCRRLRLSEVEQRIVEARCRSFEWTPPRGALAEVSLAFYKNGTVRAISGGRGDYNLPRGAIFPLQIDVIWAEPDPLYLDGDDVRCPPSSVLWVADYKSGSADNVEPIDRNHQLLAAGLLGMIWTKARAVVPAVIHIARGPGDWEAPERALVREDLAEIEATIRGTVERVAAAARALKRGAPLSYVEGGHCEYCPARSACAVKVATLRSYMSGADALAASTTPRELTPEEAQRLAQIFPAMKEITSRAREALEAHASAHGPIPLGDGKVWGPYPHIDRVILPRVAEPLLAAEVGALAARQAIKETLSYDAMEAAVKAAHEAAGIKRKVAPTMRKLWAQIGEAGGIVEETTTWWGPHRAKQAEPPPAQMTAASYEGLPIDEDKED